MGYDREDRLFVKVVGSKAVRVLKTRNIRLWNIFRQRCEENGERPESILGRYLLNFAKSLVEEEGEFAEELLGKTIKVSALVRRESLLDSLDEIVQMKKKLASAESSKIDKLIEALIEAEITKATASPIDMIRPQPQTEGKIVLDENTLAMLPKEQLDALEQMVRKVKEEKVKMEKITSEDIEEVVGYEGEEGVQEEEEEMGLSGDDKDSSGSDEGIEELNKGARLIH